MAHSSNVGNNNQLTFGMKSITRIHDCGQSCIPIVLREDKRQSKREREEQEELDFIHESSSNILTSKRRHIQAQHKDAVYIKAVNDDIKTNHRKGGKLAGSKAMYDYTYNG